MKVKDKFYKCSLYFLLLYIELDTPWICLLVTNLLLCLNSLVGSWRFVIF